MIIAGEAQSQGVTLDWYGSDGAATIADNDTEPLLSYLNNSIFGTKPSSGSDPGGVSKYQQYLSDLSQTGGSHGNYADYGYDAVLLVGAAINDAQVYDGVAIRNSLYKVANGFPGATGTDKAFNCAGDPVSQAYDFWKGVNGTVTTYQARAITFPGISPIATAPCGENPTTSPGLEFWIAMSVLGILSIISLSRKRRRNWVII